MIEVNAIGDTCPIPVVKAKNAIKELKASGIVAVLVDNEIAVQNLSKMAVQKQYGFHFEKLEEGKYRVSLEVVLIENVKNQDAIQKQEQNQVEQQSDIENKSEEQEAISGIPDRRKNTVVVISSDKMGEGNDELGKVLLKGFIYALCQLEELPAAMLFYNGGAVITTEGSDSLEDLKSLEAQGVDILTCGTCLNYYNLTEKLAVGSVTNMYAIADIMSQADKIIKP